MRQLSKSGTEFVRKFVGPVGNKDTLRVLGDATVKYFEGKKEAKISLRPAWSHKLPRVLKILGDSPGRTPTDREHSPPGG